MMEVIQLHRFVIALIKNCYDLIVRIQGYYRTESVNL